MMIVAIILCLLVDIGLGYLLWKGVKLLRARQAALLRARYNLAENNRIVQARLDLEANRQRFEDTVDMTTASVESIHRAISDLSFDVLGQRKGPARTIHDHTSERVYSGIREVNRGVGSLLSGLLGERRRDRDQDQNDR